MRHRKTQLKKQSDESRRAACQMAIQEALTANGCELVARVHPFIGPDGITRHTASVAIQNVKSA